MFFLVKYWPCLIIGVVVGAGVVLKLLNKVDIKPTVNKSGFDELIKTQLVLESLDGAAMTKWFKDNADQAKNGAVFFLVKPTRNGAAMLGLEAPPKNLNQDYTLLQAVVDQEEHLPVAIRMISFSELSSQLQQMFGEKEYIIVQQ